MTLVVGYALGPLPGFTVGALGMLASNFVLGQGPYTPWQMAAWGMVGPGRRRARSAQPPAPRARAARARVRAGGARREGGDERLHVDARRQSHAGGVPRRSPARRCRSTSPTWSRASCSALAFAPGAGAAARAHARAHGRQLGGRAEPPDRRAPPGAARRSRRRALRASRRCRGAVVGCVPRSPSRWRAPRAASAPRRSARELAFLTAAQNADGGFGGAPGQRSSELYTGVGGDGPRGRRAQPAERAPRRALGARLAARRSLDAAGRSATSSARSSRCTPAAPRRTRSPGATSSPKCCARARSDGSFAHQVNLTAFAIFALRAVGHSAAADAAIRDAAGWLERQQNARRRLRLRRARVAAATSTTPRAALQALVDAGARNRARAARRARRYLTRAQNLDGGFPQQHGGESNAQSTAWAVQGLIAAGRDPGAVQPPRQPLAARLPGEPARARTAACATRAPARRRPCG